MAQTLIAEQEVFFGAYRLTQQTSQIAEALRTAELNATVLGGATTIKEPGLKGYGLVGDGFWSATEDAALTGYQRTRNVPVSLCLTDASVGSPARSVKAMLAGHVVGPGQIGELLRFRYEAAAMENPVRGTVLHNASASGNVTGTAVNLGSATSAIVGVLHVFSGTGSFIVKIQSATDEAFTTPNDRITFATVGTGTAQSYEWATASTTGNSWWRVVATNPNTRDFAVVLALN